VDSYSRVIRQDMAAALAISATLTEGTDSD
jgi:hypothetical protein